MVINDNATAILNIVGLITICKEVFKFIKSAKDRFIPNTHTYLVKYLKKMVRPILNKDSYLIMEIAEDKIKIDSKDTCYIKSFCESEERLIGETILEQYYFISSLTFTRGNKKGDKWRLINGDYVYDVLIEDEDFLNKVNCQNFALHKDDIMKCKVKIKQYLSNKRINQKIVVEKVLEYKNSPMQQKLDLT